MILSLEQYHSLKNASGRSVGQPPKSTIQLWDTPVEEFEHIWGKCAGTNKCVGVPFRISLDEQQRKVSFTRKQWHKIRLAMDEVELNTCIR